MEKFQVSRKHFDFDDSIKFDCIKLLSVKTTSCLTLRSKLP